mmetsp:Transcript_96314/g.278025  ORF Transcript_96314/g.278025 Transcript_96314/m.278025 type:complete len:353 (+) Transcript_96314:461-1519(+)
MRVMPLWHGRAKEVDNGAAIPEHSAKRKGPSHFKMKLPCDLPSLVDELVGDRTGLVLVYQGQSEVQLQRGTVTRPSRLHVRTRAAEGAEAGDFPQSGADDPRGVVAERAAELPRAIHGCGHGRDGADLPSRRDVVAEGLHMVLAVLPESAQLWIFGIDEDLADALATPRERLPDALRDLQHLLLPREPHRLDDPLGKGAERKDADYHGGDAGLLGMVLEGKTDMACERVVVQHELGADHRVHRAGIRSSRAIAGARFELQVNAGNVVDHGHGGGADLLSHGALPHPLHPCIQAHVHQLVHVVLQRLESAAAIAIHQLADALPDLTGAPGKAREDMVAVVLRLDPDGHLQHCA